LALTRASADFLSDAKFNFVSVKKNVIAHDFIERLDSLSRLLGAACARKREPNVIPAYSTCSPIASDALKCKPITRRLRSCHTFCRR
jgi:hypothetical protein